MIVSRLAASVIFGLVMHASTAAEMGKAPATPAPQKLQPPAATLSFCNKLQLSAPPGVAKDGEYAVGSMPTPKGTLVYRGVVAKSQITDAWPTLQGRRLAEQPTVPSDVAACAARQGEKLADSSFGILDFLVPEANARWCSNPRSYTACVGDRVCATCVYSGNEKCGCYLF
ncbi:MAG TPA: hypothetical protein VJS66_08695 [Burkholderiales bacterium]|nr:hypothetical protein [Burkholderiales bacterium]